MLYANINKYQVSEAMNKDNKLLKLSEAAELLSVHPNTLRKWDKKGILKAVRFGVRKDRRYKREDVIKLVNGKAQVETL